MSFNLCFQNVNVPEKLYNKTDRLERNDGKVGRVDEKDYVTNSSVYFSIDQVYACIHMHIYICMYV